MFFTLKLKGLKTWKRARGPAVPLVLVVVLLLVILLLLVLVVVLESSI